jgi:hypothetical protein
VGNAAGGAFGVTEQGVLDDRAYALIDTERGKVVSAKSHEPVSGTYLPFTRSADEQE